MKLVEAVLYYLEDNENILMLEKGKRDGDPNSTKYTQPGGKVNPGETPLQAVRRESPEETGLELMDPVYAGEVLFDNTERTFSDMPATKHFRVHIFRATKYYRGNLKENTPEGKPSWIKKSDLERLTRHEGDKLVDEWVRDGRKFIGVIYHIGTILNKERSRVTFYDWPYLSNKTNPSSSQIYSESPSSLNLQE